MKTGRGKRRREGSTNGELLCGLLEESAKKRAEHGVQALDNLLVKETIRKMVTTEDVYLQVMLPST
jgi:hypothetical protein